MTDLTMIMMMSAVGWTLASLVAKVRSSKSVHRLSPDDEAVTDAGLVSVIIPARDEVDSIGDAVRAVLASDYSNIELLVLDDGSTDGTADVLASFNDPRLTVIQGGGNALPSGWFGKPWACHRASLKATGDWLLFVDADVRLSPEAISRTVAYAVEHGIGLLSGFGRLAEDGEQFLQPVIAGMIVVANPLSKVNDPDKKKWVVANGQFLLFSRSAYESVGGHNAVARNVLDDVGLATAIVEADQRLGMLMMQRLFTVKMYADWSETWRGWRKNLFPGMKNSWVSLGLLLVGSSIFLVGPYVVALLGLLGLTSTDELATAVAAVLAIQVFRFTMDGLFSTNRLSGQLSHGFANAAVLALLLDSAITTTRGRAVWKGRVISND